MRNLNLLILFIQFVTRRLKISYVKWMYAPKSELPELKTRSSTGPILAAISWPMLLDQYQRWNRLSVVPVLARYVGNQNWAESRHYSGKLCWMSKSQCSAQQWHFTGYKVGITPANCVVCQKACVRPNNGPSQVRKSALLWQPMLLIYYTGPKVIITLTNHLLRRRARVNKFCIKVR